MEEVVPLLLDIRVRTDKGVEEISVARSAPVIQTLRESLALPQLAKLSVTFGDLSVPDDATFEELGADDDAEFSLQHEPALPPEDLDGLLDGFVSTENVFTWNTELNTSELEYDESKLEVRKKGNAPDCSLVLGSRALESGTWYWEVQVAQQGDETWVGITNNPELVHTRHKTTDTMDDKSVCAYYDGQRSYRCPALKNGGRTMSKHVARYSSGNIVGVLVDVDARSLSFYLDGLLQHTLTDIPNGPLYPVAHMDRKDDRYLLHRTCEMLPDCVAMPELSEDGDGQQTPF